MIAVETSSIPTATIQLISPGIAWKYLVLPYQEVDNKLCFLCADTTSSDEIDVYTGELEVILGRDIQLEPYPENDLKLLIGKYYRSSRNKGKENLHLNLQGDFLENLINEAKSLGSSDIHIENYGNSARVRLRLDGVLMERFSLDTKVYSELVNKIKIRANLDIAEKRLPQDGRIEIRNAKDQFDLRVSTLPTLKHEKIVLRILGNTANHLELEQLGFSSKQLNTYAEAIRKPNGIILISGPTGSGKTTTLYATLKLLNDGKKNIVTAEDPVEYTLPGINQVHLNENIGYGFAKALRAFLRQDPDIIMVGEIRDPDTANMAVKASLTGHLVLSTIHTNSAWGTISRLIDMGVPPYLLANTLSISMAQRLVRKLCNHCKVEYTPERSEFPENWKEVPTTPICKPIGCDECHYTGYSGRIAIYEIIGIDRALSSLIQANQLDPSVALQGKGIKTLRDQAIELLLNQKTSISEIYPLLMSE